MSEHEGGSEILRDLIQHAIPVNAQGGFVTREEFVATVKTIESKIENASLRQKQWVLSGCLAILLSFGGGYMSLVSKLDRLAQALPPLIQKSDARAPWIQRQEERDSMQDEVLRKLDKSYQPLPYQVPPQ